MPVLVVLLEVLFWVIDLLWAILLARCRKGKVSAKRGNEREHEEGAQKATRPRPAKATIDSQETNRILHLCGSP